MNPRQVERELAVLWKESRTRACMSNLIVYCSGDQEEQVAAGIPAIVLAHPSRVLLLVARDGAKVEATVSTQCHFSGDRRQVCSEQITCEGPDRALPSVARPLLIGDLPTALWWAQERPPTAEGAYPDLESMADRVIYDSAGWPYLGEGLRFFRERALVTGRGFSDLAWRRFRRLRKTVSEKLDPSRAPGLFESIRQVCVRHGPGERSQAWLFVGWLASRLGWTAPPRAVREDKPLAPGPRVAEDKPVEGWAYPWGQFVWRFPSKGGAVQVLAEGSPGIGGLEASFSFGGALEAFSVEAPPGLSDVAGELGERDTVFDGALLAAGALVEYLVQ